MPDPVPPREVQAILDRLQQQHPDADTELAWRTPFELLVATILSAQSTDVRVNQVTPVLFSRFPDAKALAAADPEQLEPLIVSTGFFRSKARAIVGAARAIVAAHDGRVPAEMSQLTALPGVGRKTANVVLGHALGVPGLPVDRHVLRVANRLGIAASEDAEVVEQQLCTALPPGRWTRASDTLILHGRRICRPTPVCDRCAARDRCRYYLGLGSARAAEPAGRRPPRRSPSARTAAARPARAPRRPPRKSR